MHTANVHQKLYFGSKNPEALQKSQIFLSPTATAHCANSTNTVQLYNFACIPFGLGLFRAHLKCSRNYCASKNLETLQKSQFFGIQELLCMLEPQFFTCYWETKLNSFETFCDVKTYPRYCLRWKIIL